MKSWLIISLIIIVAIAAVWIYNPSGVEAAWYSSGGTWNYRKSITIQHGKVPDTDASGGETDFPVLIDITDSGLQVNAQSNGNDILFTSSDGSTKLAHEIEIYTSATGRLTAWVKVPTLSSTVDTVIYMYYGNASATNQQDVAPAKALVWSNGYVAVWHLGDGDSTAANFYKDSTSNHYDGTLNDSTGNTVMDSGQIGNAVDFFGDAAYIYTNTGSISFASPPFTVSQWFKTSENTLGCLVDKYYSDFNINYSTALNAYPTGSGEFYSYLWDGFETPATYDGNYNNNLWHYGVMRVTAASLESFVDGDLVASAWHNDNFPTQSNPTTFGYCGWGGGSLNGLIDEIRISSSGYTPDWIKTEYNNQSATSTFYTIGGSPEIPPEEGSAIATSSVGIRGGGTGFINVRGGGVGGVKFR